MELPKRKQNRLTDYDYSQPGCYFITICTKGKAHLFGRIDYGAVNGVGADIIRPNPMVLSPFGQIAEAAIHEISRHYENASVEKYVIMPNHIHMMIMLNAPSGRMISAPTKGIPTIVGQMKRAAAKRAGCELWQKGYHDHIIRTDADYLNIWQYIHTNPARWREDCYYREEL